MTVRSLATLAGLLLAACMLPARAAVITVGNTATDAACTIDSLDGAILIAALNGEDNDVIRLSNEITYTQVQTVISGFSVTIEGGYADCSGASGSKATLDGAGRSAAPVVKVTCGGSGCDTRRTVRLRNVMLVNGEAGGLDVGGNVSVLLDGVALMNNTGIDGGALRVDGTQGATVTLDGFSSLRNSTASGNGGGIYCSGWKDGGYAFQVVVNDALIYLNSAVNGGGVYLADGCRVRYQATGLYDGINVNTASGNGGGVAVTGGGHFEMTGNADSSTVLLNNHANQGGGVYVEGAGSIFAAVSARIDDNTSDGSGGGLFVTDGGQASLIQSYETGNCLTDPCNSLSRNIAVGGNGGGAGYVRKNGTITVRGARIFDNQARYGSAFKVSSYGGADYYGALNLAAAIVAGNYGALAVVDSYQSRTRIDGTTFYGNSGSASGFQGSLHDSGSGNTASAEDGIRVSRSLFDDGPGAPWAYVDTSSAYAATCIIAATASNSLPTPADSLITDPMLRNPAGGDFMPANRSPAIDFCGATSYLGGSTDVDHHPRGSDVLQLADVGGPYDAGAVESDLIFFGDFDPD